MNYYDLYKYHYFVLINKLEKDRSMIETLRLKNVIIFFQTIYL